MQPFISAITLPYGQKTLKGQAIHFPSISVELTDTVPNISSDLIIVQHKSSQHKKDKYYFVHRTKISQAIHYLKQHNTLYADTNVCYDNLSKLSDNIEQSEIDDFDNCSHFTTMQGDYTLPALSNILVSIQATPCLSKTMNH